MTKRVWFRAAVSAGILCASGLVGAGMVPPPAVAGLPAWHDPVDRVLGARESAIRTRDRGAFMATVDPAASESFRDDQERLFEGLASVPLGAYELHLRTDELEDLASAVPDDRNGADEIHLALVEERLRLTGIDVADQVGGLWYTFVRRGDTWYLNDDRDVADLGLLTQRMPWSYGPVVVTEGSRVVVVSRPDQVDRAQALLAITEEASDRLRASLAWTSPPKVLVVLPESTEQLEEILQTTFDLTNFVAFASADVERDTEVGGWQWTAPRVYAQESNLTRHSRDFQVETLHHELVHVVGFEKAGPFIPNWLHEGHAEYYALRAPAPRAVPGTDGLLPLDHEFVTGGRDNILRAYQESTSAVAFLARERGDGAPSALFQALGARRLVAGTWEYHLDQTLREVYGKGTAEFEADWDGGR